MGRRSKDWNEGLARDLQDREFAREFLVAALEEGVSIQVAMGKVVPHGAKSLRVGEAQFAMAMCLLFALSVGAVFTGVAAIVGPFWRDSRWPRPPSPACGIWRME